jgi:hypothetical protein
LLSPDYTYYEVSKANFLDRLEDFWQEWEVSSFLTDPLQVIPGSCCSKGCDAHLGKSAYRFRSPDGKSLNLRFVLVPHPSGGYLVKDIYPCSHLLTFERVEGEQHPLTFWVYEEDKQGTTVPEQYPILLHQARKAMAEWKELLSEGPLDLLQIHAWLRTHELTYWDAGGWFGLQEGTWRWDEFLSSYHDLALFVAYIEEFAAERICFRSGYYLNLSEEKMIPLILDIERRMELRYTVIHGTDFDMTDLTDFGKVCINTRTCLTLEGDLVRVLIDFRDWFAQERRKLLCKYFSLTAGERDAFLETAESPFQLYQVGTMLSFHLQTRERFRKQGGFIPFYPGGESSLVFPSDV